MVRTNVRKETPDGVFYMEMAGLSSDDKPTDGPIATGSLFMEVDTGDVYAYDEDGSEWDKVAALGGSGS
jgi:hypothetical protein